MLRAIAPYKKFFVYLLIGIVQAFYNFNTDDALTTLEIMQSVIFGLGLGAVYVAEETPYAKHVKTVIAALVAGLQALATTMQADLPLNDNAWFAVIIAVAGVLGVAIPKNAPENKVPGTDHTYPLEELPRAA